MEVLEDQDHTGHPLNHCEVLLTLAVEGDYVEEFEGVVVGVLLVLDLVPELVDVDDVVAQELGDSGGEVICHRFKIGYREWRGDNQIGFSQEGVILLDYYY